MSAQQVFTLDDLARWEETGGKLAPPARLAVIGDPIAHSRSPQMMNAALKKRGIDAQYIRLLVPPGSVKRAFDLLARHGFLGVNCTIPHKFEALEAMDEVDPLAAKLGSVNTVLIRDGKLTGFNSDGPGFLRSVEDTFGRKVSGMKVLVLGAGGGAGRAVAMQCALAGCAQLWLMNRTPGKAAALELDLKTMAPTVTTTSPPWTEHSIGNALPQADLIVNASPIGMKESDPPVFDHAWLHSSHLVFDMVYRADGDTPLVSAAKAAGAKTADGLILLLHQGAISFAHWFGEPVPLEAMRAGLKSANQGISR